MHAYKVFCKQQASGYQLICLKACIAVVQRDLEKLEEWTDMKLVLFNKDKCKLIHLGKNISLYNCMCQRLTT